MCILSYVNSMHIGLFSSSYHYWINESILSTVIEVADAPCFVLIYISVAKWLSGSNREGFIDSNMFEG